MKEIEYRKVRLVDMNPAPYNPRKDLSPQDKEWQDIEASLDDYGMVSPIVWNERSGNIVGGHQRYKILMAKGETETMVSVVDLDEDEEIDLNIRLNNVHGANDKRKLKELLLKMDEEKRKLSGLDVDKILATAKAKMEDHPQIEFTEELKESHNYVVLFFDNDVDWINAQSFFEIKPVHALHSHDGFVKIGTGRVLNGAKALKKILDFMDEHPEIRSGGYNLRWMLEFVVLLTEGQRLRHLIIFRIAKSMLIEANMMLIRQQTDRMQP